LSKKRLHNGRLYLILLTLVNALNALPLYAEYRVTYLYTVWKFGWDELTYSYYSTTVLGVSALGLLGLMPVMSMGLKLKDVTIGILSASSRIASELIMALSTVGLLLFETSPILIFGSLSATITRTMMSKIVSNEEQGKINSVLSLVESLIPTIGTIMYSNLYNATRETFPGAVFLISTTCAAVTTLIYGFMKFDQRNDSTTQRAEPKPDLVYRNSIAEAATVHL